MRRSITLGALGVGLVLATPAFGQGFDLVAWVIESNRWLSALKVGSKQVSGIQQQTQMMTRAAMEAGAAAVGSQDLALVNWGSRERYAYESGQGYKSCSIAGVRSDASASETAAGNLRAAQSGAVNNWLKNGYDAQAATNQSLGLRKTGYCSEEEAATTGFCSLGGKQKGTLITAGDSDASVFLLNRNYGAEEVAVAADYLDVAAPIPTIKPNPRTGDESQTLIEARRRGAMLSASRASFWSVINGGVGGDKP